MLKAIIKLLLVMALIALLLELKLFFGALIFFFGAIVATAIAEIILAIIKGGKR